ncbi:hypothetical protein GCM10027053_15100 [Intrasporangium mesophilum]
MPVLADWMIDRERVGPLLPLESAVERDAGSIVVVTGSVGAGKSTLLARWAHDVLDHGALVGWVSLSGDDNDAHALWDALLTAIQHALNAHDSEASPIVEDLVAPRLPDSGATGDLVDRLAQLETPLWIFLDDVHEVTDAQALGVLDLLLQWAPPTLNVVLGSRSDPFLHLSRLRLEGRVRDVRDDELRLSREELEEMLSAQGLVLTGPQLSRLHHLTEGWAAGAGLAAIALRTGRDVDEFLRSFESDDAAVAGYLVNELLSGLDADIQEFMFLTCLPDVLTADLATKLSGRDDAGELLRQLAGRNSLVTARHGADGYSYRYHALLRGYLRARVEGSGANRKAKLHVELAQWYLQHDGPMKALDHAVASGDAPTCRLALDRLSVGLLLSGGAATLRRLLAAAPSEVTDETAYHCLWALSCLELGDLSAAISLMDGVATGSEREAEPSRLPADRLRRVARLATRQAVAGAAEIAADTVGWFAAFTTAAADGDTKALPAWVAEHGFHSAPTEEMADIVALVAAWTGPAHVPGAVLDEVGLLELAHVGKLLLAIGQYDAGEAALREAMRTASRLGYTYTETTCLSQLAGAAGARGDLAEMRKWAEVALEAATTYGWLSLPSLLPALILASASALEGLDYRRSRWLCDAAAAIIAGPDRHAGLGLDRRPVDVSEDLRRSVRAISAYLDFAELRDDPAARRRLLQDRVEAIDELSGWGFNPVLVGSELTEHHRMAVATGQIDIAQRAIDIGAQIPDLDGDVAVLRAQHLTRLGHDAEARGLLVPVLRGTTEPLLVTSLLTAWLLESALAARNGQQTVSHDALLSALEIAGPRRAVRRMLQVAPENVESLNNGRGRFGRYEAFVDEVLTHVEVPAAPGAAEGDHARADGSVPLLTPRELSLLWDLPSLMTVAEIAEARAVSPNTVKTQLRSLFHKMGVASRRDAVSAGRRYGFL